MTGSNEPYRMTVAMSRAIECETILKYEEKTRDAWGILCKSRGKIKGEIRSRIGITAVVLWTFGCRDENHNDSQL